MGKHSDRDVQGTAWLGSLALPVVQRTMKVQERMTQSEVVQCTGSCCLLVPVCQGKSTGSGRRS